MPRVVPCAPIVAIPGYADAFMPTPIAIQSLRKVFGAGAGATVAVDSIDLRIEAGELFFLLGPSGCGKTTLLRMIAGFIEPTAGRVLLGDRDVTHLAPNKRNTGMVFQSYALWPHMTVEANVAFGLGIRRVASDEQRRRVAEALDAVRMVAYSKQKPNQLSGGQQQRVALARALVIRPDVLLLDEPLSNLDAKLRTELRSEIRRVCKESGITTVYVTHDQKEALSMADRLAILDRGRLIQVGGPRKLYRQPGSRFVAEFLGETNFLEGTAVPTDAGSRVETPAGSLASTHRLPEPKVLVSVRPEAWSLSAGQNALDATVVDSVYLGELAQHRLQLTGGVHIKVANLNPPSACAKPGDHVTVSVHPEDVVLLPA
jgi:iron(III) transport system ATP-binding protein